MSGICILNVILLFQILQQATVLKCTRFLSQPHIAVAIILRKLRADRSQLDIARQLHISYQVYQRLENPRKANPTLKTLEKVARVFGKRVELGFV